MMGAPFELSIMARSTILGSALVLLVSVPGCRRPAGDRQEATAPDPGNAGSQEVKFDKETREIADAFVAAKISDDKRPIAKELVKHLTSKLTERDILYLIGAPGLDGKNLGILSWH